MGKNEKDADKKGSSLKPPRVLADFGGRRKTFDRRLKKRNIDHFDRRTDTDRRSGFDRRSVTQKESLEPTANKRKYDPSTDIEKE